jgi:1-acyl-sn-glycerol-3-phosphate acyltransferase
MTAAWMAPPVRWLCRAVLRAVGVRVAWHGAVPAGAALLVANHRSWIDILAILAHHPCAFVGKREVRAWPVVGRCADALGVVWVDRARKRDLLRAIPALEGALRAGRQVLLFPEGTTGPGPGCLPFKSSLFEAAVRAGVPVVPLHLTGSVAEGDVDALAWYGDEALGPNLARVRRLRGATFHVTVGAPLAAAPARKPLCAAAASATSRLAKQNFRPIDSSEREIPRYRAIFSGYTAMCDSRNPMRRNSASASEMANSSR